MSSRTAAQRSASTLPARRPAASGRRWILITGTAITMMVGAALAVPFLTAPPPTPLEREQSGIEAAMERYRIAYRNRDLPAVATAFPTLPQDLHEAMTRTFENCLVYEVTFGGMEVQLTGGSDTQAEVTVRSTHTCTPQTGAGDRATSRDETFTLRKAGDGWVISAVKRGAH
jgi:hypothetical protein